MHHAAEMHSQPTGMDVHAGAHQRRCLRFAMGQLLRLGKAPERQSARQRCCSQRSESVLLDSAPWVELDDGCCSATRACMVAVRILKAAGYVVKIR